MERKGKFIISLSSDDIVKRLEEWINVSYFLQKNVLSESDLINIKYKFLELLAAK